MTLEQYIKNINSAYQKGTATEYTCRADLKQLIESIVTDIAATNEPNKDMSSNSEIINQIAKQLDLVFVSEKEPEGNVCLANNDEVRPEFRQIFTPIDILDYIYAVLHSPTYREKYKEFLNMDFPKIPYPKDSKTFWELVELGSQIRQNHLLESAKAED